MDLWCLMETELSLCLNFTKPDHSSTYLSSWSCDSLPLSLSLTRSHVCHIFALCSSLISPAASHWLLCPPKFSFSGSGCFRSGATEGGHGTREMTLKMRLGWMAPLRHRGSGSRSAFQPSLQRHFCCRRTCVTGSLCETDGPTLDILGRLDFIVMVVNVEFTLYNSYLVSQGAGG